MSIFANFNLKHEQNNQADLNETKRNVVVRVSVDKVPAVGPLRRKASLR